MKNHNKIPYPSAILAGLILTWLMVLFAQPVLAVECDHQPEALAHLLKPEEQAQVVAVVDKFMLLDWVDARGQLPFPYEHYEPLILESSFEKMTGEQALIRSYRIVSACAYQADLYWVQVLLDIAGILVREPIHNPRNGTTYTPERPQTVYDTPLGGAQSPLEGASLVAEYPTLHWKLYRPPTRKHMLFLLVSRHKETRDWRIYHGDRLREHTGIREDIRISIGHLKIRKKQDQVSCPNTNQSNDCAKVRNKNTELEQYIEDLKTLIPILPESK